MKLKKAIALLNSDRKDYFDSFEYSLTGIERAGTLSAWVEFRSSGECPDVDEDERKALKAVRKFLRELEQTTLDRMGDVYTNFELEIQLRQSQQQFELDRSPF
jgi:hypothetical protein